MSMMRCGLVIGGGTHKYVTLEISRQPWLISVIGEA